MEKDEKDQQTFSTVLFSGIDKSGFEESVETAEEDEEDVRVAGPGESVKGSETAERGESVKGSETAEIGESVEGSETAERGSESFQVELEIRRVLFSILSLDNLLLFFFKLLDFFFRYFMLFSRLYIVFAAIFTVLLVFTSSRVSFLSIESNSTGLREGLE